MGFSILSKAFQPGGLNWRLCPVPVFHRTHAVHAFCKEILIDFPEWKIRFHICKIQCLEHISLISTATNGWEIPKGNGWEGRSYNFQIKLCGKRSAMCGCPVVNERNISKSENLEIFCSQNFDCCSGKSFGENSHFPSTTLLENLVFPFRFRTNLRSKLSISYSTSKKLPTRRSISSVGSGAERAAMCAGHSAPSTHPHTMLGTEQPTGRFFKYELFSLHQVCRKALPVARGLVTSFSARRLELDTLSYLCLSQVTCWTCCLKINIYFIFRNGRGNQVIYL